MAPERHTDPAIRHQVRVARATLRMAPAMARVMGGPNHTEARAILAQYGKRPPIAP